MLGYYCSLVYGYLNIEWIMQFITFQTKHASTVGPNSALEIALQKVCVCMKHVPFQLEKLAALNF